MHIRRVILCLATLFFWAAHDHDVAIGQSSDLEEAARLYNENYRRAATAQNAGDYSSAEEWHRTNLTLVESTPGAAFDQGRSHRAGQQDRTHRLGHDGPRHALPGTAAAGGIRHARGTPRAHEVGKGK